MGTESNYKRTVAGSVGAGVGAIFSASGRTYYIIEHKTTTALHNAGDSEKIIVDQIELGRDSSCQIRFDEGCETVSRKHAAIVRDGENWKIIPLSLTNATYVNSIPVQGEKILSSGDEIRLSSHGPVMGFIIPQGAKSVVNSISMTERMELFRKQALTPYKKGLLLLTIILVLAIGGAVAAVIISNKKHDEISKEMIVRNTMLEKEMKEKDFEHKKQIEDLKKSQDKVVDFSVIENCHPAVYYIKTKNVEVYNKNGLLFSRFDQSEEIGATGFLLEDGRFVTARHVVEPWYYRNTDIIGKDSSNNIWKYSDLQLLLNDGYKVVANFIAYSPSQTSFEFSSSDMTMSPSRPANSREYKPKKYVREIVNGNLSIHYFDVNNTKDDWAILARKGELNVTDGLKYSKDASLNQKFGDEIVVLSYPNGEGFKNSFSVKPVMTKNTVNSAELNNIGVIELATNRYVAGSDGAPVLQMIDGEWTVVGILGRTDVESSRDLVTPIANIYK